MDFSSQLSDLSLGVRGRAGDYDLRGEAAGSYRWNLLDEQEEWDSGVEDGRVRSLFLDFRHPSLLSSVPAAIRP